jgi:hypothetical protein
MPQAIPSLDFLIREPAAQYHALAGDYLSSHLLADYRKCPLLFDLKRRRLIRDEDRPAYVIGQAGHTLILEGYQRFLDEYVVGGPINPKTGEPYGQNTKAFAEWQAAQGKTVLTAEQFCLIEQMATSVRKHALAAELLAVGVAEGVVRAEYCGLMCQVRLDWLNPLAGIADLKTCDDLTWFESDARRYGYAHQMAFYRAVLAQAVHSLVPVYFVAVEKREPHRTGVWRVSDDTLAIAQQENEAAIGRLQRSLETGIWETGYEGLRFFDAA